jgi:hypothetical protein
MFDFLRSFSGVSIIFPQLFCLDGFINFPITDFPQAEMFQPAFGNQAALKIRGRAPEHLFPIRSYACARAADAVKSKSLIFSQNGGLVGFEQGKISADNFSIPFYARRPMSASCFCV